MTATERQDYERKGWRQAYGVMWPPMQAAGKMVPRPSWAIERDASMGRYGCRNSIHWLGEPQHMMNFMSHLFSHEECDQPLTWNPNAVRIVTEYFNHKFLGIAGHVSSGKTRVLAGLGYAEFMRDPQHTGVLLTSTTIEESRLRIWGDVERFHRYASAFYGNYFSQLLGRKVNGDDYLPGELVSSKALIRMSMTVDGRQIRDDQRGLKLIPGHKTVAEEGVGRMKGYKPPRLTLIADELSDLSHRILDAAETTLFKEDTGKSSFRMAASLNPGDMLDPGGKFCEPEGDWESINVTELDGWKTKRKDGYCIRFDGAKSPNVVAGREIYPGLLTLETYEAQKRAKGDNSPEFQRYYRAIWPTGGRSDSIYSLDEIMRHGGRRRGIFSDIITSSTGFDPSFSNGGDRAPVVTLWSGHEDDKIVVEFGELKYMDENLNPSEDKKEQLVRRIVRYMTEEFTDRSGGRFVPSPRTFGMDITGAGDVMASWISTKWAGASQMLKVSFGSKASDKIISSLDPRKSCDRFADRMSEMWYIGKELLQSEQIRNLPDVIINQIRARNYSDKGGKIKVEPKKEMKKRIGFSPDEADAFFIALHVLTERFGLTSKLNPMKAVRQRRGPDEFDFSCLAKKPQGSHRSAVARFHRAYRQPHG